MKLKKSTRCLYGKQLYVSLHMSHKFSIKESYFLGTEYFLSSLLSKKHESRDHMALVGRANVGRAICQ